MKGRKGKKGRTREIAEGCAQFLDFGFLYICTSSYHSKACM